MENEPRLLPREKILRDTFTPAETALFILILIAANVSFWLADPRSLWLHGFFIIAASLVFVLLKTHERTHPFFVTFLWPKFWLCTAPVWLVLFQFSAGALRDPIHETTFDGVSMLQFAQPTHSWLPVSAAAGSNLLPLLGFLGIFLISVGLFLIPKSQAFFDKLFPSLCLSASLPAVFGYLQAGLDLEKPLLTRGTTALDFFAFFPYDGHWAAFAAIWCCASIALALLTTRYDKSAPFLQSTGPWYLAAGILFGASSVMVEARWPAVFLQLTFALMLLLFSAHFFRDNRDPQRKLIAWTSGVAAVAATALALFRVLEAPSGADAPFRRNLQNAAAEMFADSPVFGWGFDSFSHLLPYYGSDLLMNRPFERAGMDVLQLLAELGLFGLVSGLTLLLVLIGRYIRGRHNIALTNHLLLGLFGILILAFFDSPFMSPAVFLSFLILLFAGLRWADVTRNRADEIDSPKPQLVSPENERRVPFYPKTTKEKLR